MKLGAHTQEVGNIGESFVFQFCLELSQGENSTVLAVAGWNLDLSKRLLQAGRNLIFVHHKREVLRDARAELTELLSDNDIVTRRFQFRTICRPPESDMSKLVEKVSAIVLLGALHHMANPREMLAWLLRTGRPLVVWDTTRELIIKRIAEDRRLRRPLCDEHLLCIGAATKASLNVKGDVTQILMGKDCVRWPQLFEYGNFAWMAAWEGV